ncbi:unnamed protein product [Caenorhabditis angaria]|uniref:Uncharacterized protein n=1 Tax=Caenorhabditis angaria TaxID=860376 RepID=A0A9P1N030_9PELO|nr:unnamed protein product [Caenorhabditis angaria]
MREKKARQKSDDDNTADADCSSSQARKIWKLGRKWRVLFQKEADLSKIFTNNSKLNLVWFDRSAAGFIEDREGWCVEEQAPSIIVFKNENSEEKEDAYVQYTISSWLARVEDLEVPSVCRLR